MGIRQQASKILLALLWLALATGAMAATELRTAIVWSAMAIKR